MNKKLALVSTISFASFVLLGIAVRLGFVEALNTHVAALFSFASQSPLTPLVVFLTHVGSPLSLFVFTFLVAVYLLLVHKDRYVKPLILSAAVCAVSVYVAKIVFAVARPENGILTLTSHSYPSGHAAVALFVLFATAFIFSHVRFVTKHARALYGVAIFLSICIAVSRVYLSVHFASDIVGGFLLGMTCVCIFVAGIRPR